MTEQSNPFKSILAHTRVHPGLRWQDCFGSQNLMARIPACPMAAKAGIVPVHSLHHVTSRFKSVNDDDAVCFDSTHCIRCH